MLIKLEIGEKTKNFFTYHKLVSRMNYEQLLDEIMVNTVSAQELI